MNAPSNTSHPGKPVRTLERLLRPRSIAVFGGNHALAVIEQCRKMDFTGAIWPVHPSRSEIGGMPAFASVEALPGSPDACFIGVNRHATPSILSALRLRNAGGAICFAAGFRETGNDDADGPRLEAELVEAAGDMPVIGPNCYGLINYCDGALLWPDQHGGKRLRPGQRGAAIIMQSSNIAINVTMQRRGLPISYIMTVGNQAQTGMSEMALGLLEDDRVSVLGLHIEGFDSIDGFERLAKRAREVGKPVVAMKVGRTEQARSAAISHTASLAGSDVVSNAFLRRLGIARVESIPAFLETLKLLHIHGPLGGCRLSSMSCSGGEAAVMADAAYKRRAHFPPLVEKHRRLMRDALGPIPAIANPLDYHTFIWNDVPAMTRTFSAMVSGGFDLNLLVLDFPRNDRCQDADWLHAAESFQAALSASGAKGAIVATMPENLPEWHADALMEKGIAPLAGVSETFDAIEAAAFIGESWSSGDASKTLVPATATGRTARMIDESAAKAALAEAGLMIPAGKIARSVEEAIEAGREIGFPVALKIIGIAHKSEKGAISLGLSDEAAVQTAAENLLAFGFPLLVERMIQDPIAELIVGITRDPLFGPVLTMGTGGIFVELFDDSETLLLPVTPAEIESALRRLKLFALLDGFRNRPKADLNAAVAAIGKIADFAAHNWNRIVELDVNPLILCEKGAFVADAVLVLEDMHE